VSGSSKDVNRWLQAYLKSTIDDTLVVDGDLGPRSRSAIKEFQKRHDLAADGIPGPATISAAEAASGTRAPGHADEKPSQTLHTAAVARGPDADNSEDDADADADAASDDSTVAITTPPAHTYAEQRIGVRLYGKLAGDSHLLVPVPSVGGQKRLHKLAAAALVRMSEASKRDLGLA
jgi:peptidoglycan hydrolase-like protein with peptidoglycan-binding domain